MVSFSAPEKRFSERDLLVLTYAIYLGYEIEGKPGPAQAIRKSPLPPSQPFWGLAPRTKLIPKRSTRAETIEILLKTDPFIQGLSDALNEPGIQNTLERDNLLAEARTRQYLLGFSKGQEHAERFQKTLGKIQYAMIQQMLKEGCPEAKYN